MEGVLKGVAGDESADHRPRQGSPLDDPLGTGAAAEPEKGYVMVLRNFLPPAMRGLMIAAFLAAFMSTVGTQLNWGTSYLINDFYRRFLVCKGTEKHYVMVSKLMIILLVILSGYTAAHINSIQSAWQLLLGMGAGTGGVLLLRWYWWRINAWSEITSMITAFVVSMSLERVAFTGDDSVVFAKKALITAGATTLVWLCATFITKPESDELLLKFYRRVRPSVYGWQRIARLAPEIIPVKDLGASTVDLNCWKLRMSKRAAPSTACAGSKGFTPSDAAVVGMSCMRPSAPAGLTAFGLKPDSCFATAARSDASMRYRVGCKFTGRFLPAANGKLSHYGPEESPESTSRLSTVAAS